MFAPATPPPATASVQPQTNTPTPQTSAAATATATDPKSFQPQVATPAVNPERVGDRPKDGRSRRKELEAQEFESEFDDDAAIWAFAAFLPRSCPFLAHYSGQEILKIAAKHSRTNLTAAAVYRRIYGLGLQNGPPLTAATPTPDATPAPAEPDAAAV